MTQAFPLQWPHGRPRSKYRHASTFRVTPAKAYDEMMDELERFGAKSVVVSTNIPLRRDGTPYRDGLNDRLADPGVAVYFMKGKRQVCLPCDAYSLPWENCRAIGKAVEALRTMERHGAQQILDQAFEGFVALPPPADGAKAPDWWDVLGVSQTATEEEVREAWRAKCREAGGATVELNAARDAAMIDILARTNT